MIASTHAFVVNRPLAALFAALAILVPVGVAHTLAKVGNPRNGDPVHDRRRGLGALIIGADGRASTSKTQAVLWTGAVFFAIAFMLLWGRSNGCDDADKSGGTRCQHAAAARTAFSNFTNRGLQEDYFVLLGFPVAVAVAAKGIAVANAGGSPTPPNALTADDAAAKGGTFQSLKEIVSSDQGDTDLLDFQYFAFNLLTLTFFFVQFLTHPVAGLPDLPPTLVALSGISAGGYTTKKALSVTGLTMEERGG